MPSLSCRSLVRLSLVSDFLNESGMYDVESFNDAELDCEVDEAEIDELLDKVLDHLFDGGTCYEICDDWYNNGWYHIPHGDSVIKVRDVTEKINCEEESQYYVLFKQDLSEYRWVAAERVGNVYTD